MPVATLDCTALVFGASGMGGSSLVQHLLSLPKSEWPQIFTVSRDKNAPIQDARVKHISLNLFGNLQNIKSTLQSAGVKNVTHVFYTAYVEKPTEEELWDVNVKMFLNALEATCDVAKELKHFCLQTGTKYYGFHLSPVDSPVRENHPRYKGLNFYYGQEDALVKKCHDEGNKWTYSICRPDAIHGVAKSNFMNLATTLAIYCSLLKELGQPLRFPGNSFSYNRVYDATYAPYLAKFEVWTSTNPSSANQAFNCVNGDVFRYRHIFAAFSRYFSIPLSDDPPVDANEGEGIKCTIKLASEMPKHESTWNNMVKKYGLVEDGWNYATWSFADLWLSRTWETLSNMSKARECGWTDYVDTEISFAKIFDSLKQEKIIPNFDA